MWFLTETMCDTITPCVWFGERFSSFTQSKNVDNGEVVCTWRVYRLKDPSYLGL